MTAFEKIRQEMDSRVLVAAHRGVCSGNIPPNTLAAFDIALRYGTDIIECDITPTADGKILIFHTHTEPSYTRMKAGQIEESTLEQVLQEPLLNVDSCPTQYSFPTLDETLEHLKNRCYINLDQCWSCFEDVIRAVRAHGMEEQILLKSKAEAKYLDMVEALAPDIAYMPVYYEYDNGTQEIMSRNIHFFGAELVFQTMDSHLSTREYIEHMHKLGKKLWINAIVFNHKRILSGGKCDDLALLGDEDGNWGWMCDMGYDIIQTDWPIYLHQYLQNSGKGKK